jgi:flagellar protein FliO/FliZ
MFETLFGAEMPLAVRFFLAFLIVLGLIGVTAWAVRRFGSGRLGGSSARGRQPRLAVIDYASVDARRRLILVRRDNVEHLLMIGGPTDVVVEPNIVRASAPPREVAPARPPAIEALPRAIPLPEHGDNGSWPLQPEPAATPRPAPRLEAEEPQAWPLQPHGEAPPRPQRDTLAALADELSTRPAPPPAPAPAPQRNRPPAGPRPFAPEPRAEARPEPRMPATPPVAAADTDQSLAEMAHRLEAALRKPSAAVDARDSREPRTVRTPAAPARPVQPAAPPPPVEEEESEEAVAAAPPPPRPVRAAEPRPVRPDAKPPQGKTLYDSLEQEMASLLGRPTNKTG